MSDQVTLRVIGIGKKQQVKTIRVQRGDWDAFLLTASNKCRIKATRAFLLPHKQELTPQLLGTIPNSSNILVTTDVAFPGAPSPPNVWSDKTEEKDNSMKDEDQSPVVSSDTMEVDTKQEENSPTEVNIIYRSEEDEEDDEDDESDNQDFGDDDDVQYSSDEDGPPGPSPFSRPNDKARRSAIGIPANDKLLRTVLEPDEAFFKPIRMPRPGDWLWEHKEKREPFNAAYRRKHADIRRRCRGNKILLLPIGAFDKDRAPAVATLAEFASIFFQLPVEILPKLEIVHKSDTRTVFTQPSEKRTSHLEFHVTTRINPITHNQQLLTKDLQLMLKTMINVFNGACVIGVTMTDLYPSEGWNFVFGQAIPSRHVGVFSFARYSPDFSAQKKRKLSTADSQKLLWRSCSVMVHEIGHMFGLDHCVYFNCIMNGSNHLEESDKAPLELCPVCLHKLYFVNGFNIMTRYTQFHEFCKQHSMVKEVKWFEERISTLQAKLNAT